MLYRANTPIFEKHDTIEALDYIYERAASKLSNKMVDKYLEIFDLDPSIGLRGLLEQYLGVNIPFIANCIATEIAVKDSYFRKIVDFLAHCHVPFQVIQSCHDQFADIGRIAELARSGIEPMKMRDPNEPFTMEDLRYGSDAIKNINNPLNNMIDLKINVIDTMDTRFINFFKERKAKYKELYKDDGYEDVDKIIRENRAKGVRTVLSTDILPSCDLGTVIDYFNALQRNF